MDEVGKRMRLERLYSHPHQALRASFSRRVKPFTRCKTQFTRPLGAIHATSGSNSRDQREQFTRPAGAIHATSGSNSRCVSNNSLFSIPQSLRDSPLYTKGPCTRPAGAIHVASATIHYNLRYAFIKENRGVPFRRVTPRFIF